MNTIRLEAARREVANVVDPIAHLDDRFDRLASGDEQDIVNLHYQIEALLERTQSDGRLRLGYGASAAIRLLQIQRRFFTTSRKKAGAEKTLRAMKSLRLPPESIEAFSKSCKRQNEASTVRRNAA